MNQQADNNWIKIAELTSYFHNEDQQRRRQFQGSRFADHVKRWLYLSLTLTVPASLFEDFILLHPPLVDQPFFEAAG